MRTEQRITNTLAGWLMLPVLILVGVGVGYLIYLAILNLIANQTTWAVVGLALRVLLLGVFGLLMAGFFTLQPNQAAVLILFGKYRGTANKSGFHWANPLLSKKKISLRSRNLNMEQIKVNDLRGNPIEIAAVVVWRVNDTAQALFDVDDYESYVAVQSEAALRHLASAYPYDTTEGETQSLRGSMDEVSERLEKELQERVNKAGCTVEEARLSHLAYAPEIASVMLQRQQAEAIVAARSRIVDGAVGMVEMALHKLEENKTIQLDDERKAAMVSNLLVVLCGDKAVHPVVNAGTLY